LPEELQTSLARLATKLGADLFGAANLTVAQEFICEQGGKYLKKFPRAISIGIRLLDAVVDELLKHKDAAVILSYFGLYNSANLRLDQISLLLSKEIQEQGYKAYPIPTSQIIDSRKLIGVISHKIPAHLAGLGWIGKSCLLITPNYGPRVRFATILTDAPLRTGSPITQQCHDCRACVDICPVGAFTGITFNPSEPREARFKAHLCRDYRLARATYIAESKRDKMEGLCGLCVYVCPYGRQEKCTRP